VLQGSNHHLIPTKDGSYTFFSPVFQESYHSVNGALEESNHVFIENGLNALLPKTDTIHILETGMGTGLNLLLTFLKSGELSMPIHYTALEYYPLTTAMIEAYRETDPFIRSNMPVFDKIHTSDWETENSLALNFHFTKKLEKIEDLCAVETYDLIYFDAFAPDTQPELWTTDVMEKMFRALKPTGILVTYCAKGQVRRNMKAAGFSIEKLPGPTGKREMTRAIKPDLYKL
jgi:tRNA U34 5-methylaminomethyl-2-thiouridine-forming methyltransferase MnmC